MPSFTLHLHIYNMRTHAPTLSTLSFPILRHSTIFPGMDGTKYHSLLMDHKRYGHLCWIGKIKK